LTYACQHLAARSTQTAARSSKTQATAASDALAAAEDRQRKRQHREQRARTATLLPRWACPQHSALLLLWRLALHCCNSIAERARKPTPSIAQHKHRQCYMQPQPCCSCCCVSFLTHTRGKGRSSHCEHLSSAVCGGRGLRVLEKRLEILKLGAAQLQHKHRCGTHTVPGHSPMAKKSSSPANRRQQELSNTNTCKPWAGSKPCSQPAAVLPHTVWLATWVAATEDTCVYTPRQGCHDCPECVGM
jgi:hypothetical protein